MRYALSYPLFIISYDHLHFAHKKEKIKDLFKEMTINQEGVIPLSLIPLAMSKSN